MTPLEIKIALIRKRVSMRDISRQIGVSPSAVTLVVQQRMISRRIMDAVASAIGKRTEDVFDRLSYREESERSANEGSFHN